MLQGSDRGAFGPGQVRGHSPQREAGDGRPMEASAAGRGGEGVDAPQGQAAEGAEGGRAVG
eukprot:9417625-Pyramimonas_sp.AAC.1